jgi:hypothetical protein
VKPAVVPALAAAVVQAEAHIRSLELRFYQRMRERVKGSGSGIFITAEEIDQRNPTRTTQMLEGVPSVKLRLMQVFREGRKGWAPVGQNGCGINVYVDGVRLARLGVYDYAADLDDVVNPRSVAGIEVYSRGGQAPAEYQAFNGSCGVILIWTKS